MAAVAPGSSDDPYIGRRLRREFYGVWIQGTVVSFQPAVGPSGEEVKLWQVKYDDGDGEDLEVEEVEEAIAMEESMEDRDEEGNTTRGIAMITRGKGFQVNLKNKVNEHFWVDFGNI